MSVKITFYKNSLLASLVNLLGRLIALGVVLIRVNVLFNGDKEEKIFGILLIAVGIILLIITGLLCKLILSINELIRFKFFENKIKKGNREELIRSSVDEAIKVYNEFPCKKTLNYIKELNPVASSVIINLLSNKSNIQASNLNTENRFDPFLTGQLVALSKSTKNKAYSVEYKRRLTHIGFTEEEARNMFIFESMIMKNNSYQLLQGDTYLTDNYFDLKHKVLSQSNEYYVEHQSFIVSEVTKLWDEAEWLCTYKNESDTPSDVWEEIFSLTRYGGGELFVNTIKSMSEKTNIELDKVQKYAMAEQCMLFKYKWYRDKNEPHPYH